MASPVDFLIRGNATGATRALDKVSGGVGRVTGAVGKLGAALGVTFGVAGMAAALKSSIDTADRMEKLERKIGVTTEALSELKFAGEQSGIEFEAFAKGMERASSVIAEAAAGTGEGRAAILELGLDAKKLAALKPEAQLEVIADAMKSVSNESDRTRLAMDLFGRRGTALLQIMGNGSEEIRALREEARQLGLTLSHEDAVAAAEANDAMNRFKSAMAGVSKETAINLAPALTDFANGLAQSIPTAVNTSILAMSKLEIAGLSIASTFAKVRLMLAMVDEAIASGIGYDEGVANAIALEKEMAAVVRIAEDTKTRVNTAALAEVQSSIKVAATYRDVHGPAVEDVASKYGKLTYQQAQLAITAENAQAKLEAMGDSDFAKKLGESIQVDLGDTSENVFDQMRSSFRQTLRQMLNDLLNAQLQESFTKIFGFFGLGGGGSSAATGKGWAGIPFKLPGAASGMSFTIPGGYPGTDRTLVAFAGTEGEHVQVTPAGQRPGGPISNVVIHQTNHFEGHATPDPALLVALKRNNEQLKAEIIDLTRRRRGA